MQGPNAIAGEWGHNPLPWPQKLDGALDERPGPECYCGRRGCIETFASGPGLERDFGQTARTGTKKEAAGQCLTAAEIVAFTEANDPEAGAALSRYEHRLARILASAINVFDSGVIVLGGVMSNARNLYKNVPEIWGTWVFSDSVTTHLLPAAHGDSSGVRKRPGCGKGNTSNRLNYRNLPPQYSAFGFLMTMHNLAVAAVFQGQELEERRGLVPGMVLPVAWVA